MDNLCGFIRYFFILGCLLLTSCLSVPEGVVPVNNFVLDRYLGRWYEVARLDHSFERDLQAVTAEYVTRDDGGIKVINSGPVSIIILLDSLECMGD